MKRKRDKEVLKFLQYLTKLEIIEAIGVARLLGVELIERKEKEDADSQSTASISEKDYDIILSEITDAFIATNKNKRKFILSVMENSIKNA